MTPAHTRPWISRLAALCCGLAFVNLSAASDEPLELRTDGLLSRVARLLDPNLARMEDRVGRLDRSVLTPGGPVELPLKVAMGFRGRRVARDVPDPVVVLDLGRAVEIDAVALVPAQREFVGDAGLFPKRFTLEVAETSDFARGSVLHASGNSRHDGPDGAPTMFRTRERGRFVRLTVHEGCNADLPDLFALSELVVISNGDPVSFGSVVSAFGGLEIPGLWSAAALTDGCTPFGVWQEDHPLAMAGGDVVAAAEGETAVWNLDLDEAAGIDRILLFPYRLSRPIGESVLPNAIEVRTAATPDGPWETLVRWTNPVPGDSRTTPMVIPATERPIRCIQVVATQPWMVNRKGVHALSEIEVWAGGRNLAAGRMVRRDHGGRAAEVGSLTDGIGPDSRIVPVSTWLEALEHRSRVNDELERLRPLHQDLSERSRIHAAWCSAAMIGVALAVPLVVIGRSQLMPRRQLDQFRSRVACDLHDDIGSNLGSISMIARLARRDLARLRGPEEIARDLDEMETIARESSLAMRDIVWLLERHNESVGDLAERMRETAARLLRGIDFDFECKHSKAAVRLTPEAKRHLFLFYKESLHNILKHAGASRVDIRMRDEDDKLVLEIHDNGSGVPPPAAAETEVPRKLADRARALDGKLEFHSTPDAGTTVTLRVKRSHLSPNTILS